MKNIVNILNENQENGVFSMERHSLMSLPFVHKDAVSIYTWTFNKNKTTTLCFEIKRIFLEQVNDINYCQDILCHLLKPWVYILIESGAGNQIQLYVWETEHLYKRIQQHYSRKNIIKAFCFTNLDNKLNKAHIKYLEYFLYELLKKQANISLTNYQIPVCSKLSDSDKDYSIATLNHIFTFLEIFQFISRDIFFTENNEIYSKRDRRESIILDENKTYPSFECSVGKTKACFIWEWGEFVLLEGSEVAWTLWKSEYEHMLIPLVNGSKRTLENIKFSTLQSLNIFVTWSYHFNKNAEIWLDWEGKSLNQYL